jgi:CheY-like chemotaxis protein
MTRRPRTVGGFPPRSALAPLPTILLLEADEDARAMVRDALLEGAKPSMLRTVGNAQELDEYFASGPAPSLVMVDLDLPDGDGLRAVRAVKETRRRIPVVALTHRSDPETVAAAYDAGANTVLPRPVTFLALVRLMKVFTAYWLEAASLPEETA